MFSDSQSATCFKVLARGVLIKEGAVQSKTEAEDVLRKTASMQLCAGAVRHEDYDEALFTTKLTDYVLTRQGLYFSRNCLGHVPKQGTYLFLFMNYESLCSQCKSDCDYHPVMLSRNAMCILPLPEASFAHTAIPSPA